MKTKTIIAKSLQEKVKVPIVEKIVAKPRLKTISHKKIITKKTPVSVKKPTKTVTPSPSLSQKTQLAQATQTSRQTPQASKSISLVKPSVNRNPNYRTPPSPPAYPRRAKRLHQQGTVIIRALVSSLGHVIKTRIFNSSSHPLLDKSAMTAVQLWEFIPARNNGQPVESWVQVPVNFVLN